MKLVKLVKSSILFFYNGKLLLENGEYPNILILAAYSNNLLSSETSSPVKNSYLPTFPDVKLKSWHFACLNYIELCFARFVAFISRYRFVKNIHDKIMCRI